MLNIKCVFTRYLLIFVWFTDIWASLLLMFPPLFGFLLVAKLLYKSKCSSVCQPLLGGNVIFSAPNLDRGLISSSFATYGCFHNCLISKQFLLDHPLKIISKTKKIQPKFCTHTIMRIIRTKHHTISFFSV